ncbi:DUF2059 domain-containing protein [Flavobacterium wongokense]|uniref:DUF2059 domain-containing protein n=1 Tax=Flavobacterium wongokense TaxID=2910674 RepID=UPI001F390FC0|nr:DUF2059 domain-containing protein [Flavobacterium sp. WG47]MCF6133352.1 DUF2059 domain-containing protein [Flavobacterium sp. WG47]
MKKLVITAMFAFVSVAGMAQEKASREDVYKVIENSGAAGQMSAIKKQILGMIPQDKQAAFLVEFDVIIKKANEKTVDVYLEEFTKQDIKAMLDFYNSPTGKKMAQKSEVIATKSQEAMAGLQSEIQAMVMKYMQ